MSNPDRGSQTLLLNKPYGVLSQFTREQGSRWGCLADWVSVPEVYAAGRLDADSRGALLLTDQGELTLKLTHPRYDHRKTYRVWVRGQPDSAALDRWRRGLNLDGRITRPAQVRSLRSRAGNALLEVELQEGRNRQIRRIAEGLGHPVLDLQRVAIAGLALGDLTEGGWRLLQRREWAPMLDGEAPPRSGSCA